jgi:hypothetical protein
MSERSRTDLCGGRRATGVPTATPRNPEDRRGRPYRVSRIRERPTSPARSREPRHARKLSAGEPGDLRDALLQRRGDRHRCAERSRHRGRTIPRRSFNERRCWPVPVPVEQRRTTHAYVGGGVGPSRSTREASEQRQATAGGGPGRKGLGQAEHSSAAHRLSAAAESRCTCGGPCARRHHEQRFRLRFRRQAP